MRTAPWRVSPEVGKLDGPSPPRHHSRREGRHDHGRCRRYGRRGARSTITRVPSCLVAVVHAHFVNIVTLSEFGI